MTVLCRCAVKPETKSNESLKRYQNRLAGNKVFFLPGLVVLAVVGKVVENVVVKDVVVAKNINNVKLIKMKTKLFTHTVIFGNFDDKSFSLQSRLFLEYSLYCFT